MFGAIIGDIAGSRFEWDDYKSKCFKLFGDDEVTDKICEITDDSVTALAVCDALLEWQKSSDDKKLKDLLIDKMQYHCKKRMNAGYGNMFYAWLKSGSRSPYNSFGNGAAIRGAAAGWYAKSLTEAEHIAEITASVTHDHPEGIKGAVAVAGAVFLAKNGAHKPEISKYISSFYNTDFRLSDIRGTYKYDATCIGTVPVAMAAFAESNGFTDAIKNAVSVGGDSDTLAAITGAVAEAHYGVSATIRKRAMAYLDDELRSILMRFVIYTVQQEKNYGFN